MTTYHSNYMQQFNSAGNDWHKIPADQITPEVKALLDVREAGTILRLCNDKGRFDVSYYRTEPKLCGAQLEWHANGHYHHISCVLNEHSKVTPHIMGEYRWFAS